jgi:AbrB family looped-hinge helix DNA binding protein
MGAHVRLTTAISTKGQVIPPEAVRDQLHWVSGTRFKVENAPDGVLLKATPMFAETSVNDGLSDGTLA